MFNPNPKIISDLSNTAFIRSLKSGLYGTTKTLGLTALGTSALVGAHHLGRKQYDANARLSDYVYGFGQAITKIGADNKQRIRIWPQLATLVKQPATAADDAKTQNPTTTVKWVSGVADLRAHEFAVVGIDCDRKICWQTPMPERVHDILIQPHRLTHHEDSSLNTDTHVAVMGRRPSESFWILDAHSGDLLHSIKAESNRHFYGHACYSFEGDLLYVTENNTLDFGGLIGIYEVASGYKKIAEFSTQGIGPHEIVIHPNGETLIIANGGIKTEKASREELNIDTMRPSLVYLDRRNGRLIQQVFPEHNQMSVRHLAMHENGTVVIGIQFQGERHLSVPLVLIHRLGEEAFTALKMVNSQGHSWRLFHHYIASVGLDCTHNLVCVTSPIGGCAAVFDLTTREMVEAVELADCAGVATYPNSGLNLGLDDKESATQPVFLVSDGQGNLTTLKVSGSHPSYSIKVDKVQQPYAFDNHLNVVKA